MADPTILVTPLAASPKSRRVISMITATKVWVGNTITMHLQAAVVIMNQSLSVAKRAMARIAKAWLAQL